MSEEAGDVSTIVDEMKTSFLSSLFVIPEFLDFQNSFLLVLFLVLFFLEIVYLCLPQMLLKKLEELDFNEKMHKISYTGASAIVFFILIVVSFGQEASLSMTQEERLHMNAIEKGFKYKQKFMNEITLYIEVLIFSIFCVFNHTMSVNRKRAYYQ